MKIEELRVPTLSVNANTSKELGEIAHKDGRKVEQLLQEVLDNYIAKRKREACEPTPGKLADLCGVAPGAWGDEDAQDYIRRQRKEWE